MAGVAGMSGLMVELADRYVLTSNREERKAGCACPGRYDIILEPRKGAGEMHANGMNTLVICAGPQMELCC